MENDNKKKKMKNKQGDNETESPEKNRSGELNDAQENSGETGGEPADKEGAPAESQDDKNETTTLDIENELQGTKDRLLRLHADFDNYRKRVQREKQEWFSYACQGLLEKMLPVIDNLERALDSIEEQDEEVKNVFSGIAMIYRQLMEVLRQEGLEPIQAQGQLFNPELHEAMMQEPAGEGQQDNEIVEELRRGYKYKDRVIRPSLVKVAKLARENQTNTEEL